MQSIYWDNISNLFWSGIAGDLRYISQTGYLYSDTTLDSSGHAYWFGSTIRRLAKDQWYFRNDLLPAGEVIYKWDLLFAYPIGRAFPRLPLLTPGHRYQLRLHADIDDPTTIYLRMITYDFQGKLTKNQMINGMEGEVTYQEKAYNYTLELVSGGCTELTFERIDVVDVTDLAEDAYLLTDQYCQAHHQELIEQEAKQRSIINQAL